MGFNENLHFILESRGILIKELAAKTGISENTLKTYLRKDCAEATLSKAVRIAEALQVSLDELVKGEKSQTETVSADIQKLISVTQNFSRKDFHVLLATAKAIQENNNSNSYRTLL